MENHKILVTGVGAIIGYGIVRSLRQIQPIPTIIGMDIYEDAIGQIWCDKFMQGERADSQNYADFVLKVVAKEQVDLIIPGIEQDIDALVKILPDLQRAGARVVLNSASALNTFNDKLATSELLQAMDLPWIPTLHSGETTPQQAQDELGLPLIAKPITSYAGKGLSILRNEQELRNYCNRDDYILQRYIENGTEFTASVFGLGDGSFCNPIILQRTLGPDGATHKAHTIESQEILEQMSVLCKETRPEGPTNFQFINSAELPEYRLLEVNPRISSSTSLRAHFGVNEAHMCIQFYLQNKKPEAANQKKGTARRYIEDHVEYDRDHL